jgi:hypothetical protein
VSSGFDKEKWHKLQCAHCNKLKREKLERMREGIFNVVHPIFPSNNEER